MQISLFLLACAAAADECSYAYVQAESVNGVVRIGKFETVVAQKSFERDVLVEKIVEAGTQAKTYARFGFFTEINGLPVEITLTEKTGRAAIVEIIADGGADAYCAAISVATEKIHGELAAHRHLVGHEVAN